MEQEHVSGPVTSGTLAKEGRLKSGFKHKKKKILKKALKKAC